MKLFKVLALLLGLAVVAWVAKTQLEGAAGASSAHTQPRQQLDQVRDKAHQIEQDAQKRMDEAVKKADPQ